MSNFSRSVALIALYPVRYYAYLTAAHDPPARALPPRVDPVGRRSDQQASIAAAG